MKRIHFIYSLLGGGWTVIQQRVDAYVSFERKWVDYKHGFGSFAGSFWFGNDRIHNLTKSSTDNVILFDIVDATGTKYQPAFTDFRVEDENTGYTFRVGADFDLGLGDFSAIQNNFRYHNNNKFSTMDVDNDNHGGICSTDFFGNAGWWFNACRSVNLNGRFGAIQSLSGLTWSSITNDAGSRSNLRSSRMLVRRM